MVNKKRLLEQDDKGELAEALAQALQNVMKKFLTEEQVVLRAADVV